MTAILRILITGYIYSNILRTCFNNRNFKFFVIVIMFQKKKKIVQKEKLFI